MLRLRALLHWTLPLAALGVTVATFVDPTSPPPIADVKTAPPANDELPLVATPTIVPEAPEAACDEGVEAARAAIVRSDESLASEELLDLCTTTRAAVRVPSCATRLHDLLRASATCNHAYQTVLSCAVPDPSFTATLTRDLLANANDRCRVVVVQSLHQASSVDLALARLVVARAITEPKAARRSHYELALGSIGHAARAIAAPDVASFVDATLERDLHAARGSRRQVLLEAAGNAGCASCLGEARASLHDADEAIRRSAVRAYRFVATSDALDVMCDALKGDERSETRVDAAWSLQWSASNESRRADCLARAARNDVDDRVRSAAAQSLLALAARSPAAATALSLLEDDRSAQSLSLELAFPSAPSTFDPLAVR